MTDNQYSGEVCTVDDGLINPAAFPCKSADLDTTKISGSGDQVAAIGTSVLAAAQAAQTAWTGLQAPGVFETPDQEAVYALMTPAVDGATTMEGVTGRVKTAIHTYADALEKIKTDLIDIETRAAKFRKEAQAGYEVTKLEAYGSLAFSGGSQATTFATPGMDPMEKTTISWEEHEPAVAKNKKLVHEYNVILERISTAATTCANTIQAELTLLCVAPAEKITAEMLDASDLPTWGRPVQEKRNCNESIGHGLGNFWHNTWTGAASLIGRDATTGAWSPGVAGRSWLGVGDFLLSTVIVVAPGVNIAAAAMSGQDNEFGHFLNDRFNTAVGGWGGLIGWDQQAHLAGQNGWHAWEEDGAAALTESVANIGTFFIPVAGWAGGGAKTAIAGTRVGALIVKTVTHVGEIAIPAGSHLVAGVVKVIDLGATGIKGGWRSLVDALKPTTVHPNGAPGVFNAAERAPLPEHKPVSEALGLDRSPGSGADPARLPEVEKPPVRPVSEAPGAPGHPGDTAPGGHGGGDAPHGGKGADGSGHPGTTDPGDGGSSSLGSHPGSPVDGGTHSGTGVDSHGAHTTVERGESHVVGGPDGPVPDNLHDLSEGRVEAIENAKDASAQFTAEFDAFNDALKQEGLPPVDRSQFTADKIKTTLLELRKEYADRPDLMDQLDDLSSATAARKEALVGQSRIGEEFGEAAGHYAADKEGLQSVMTEPHRPSGTVDQAYKAPDDSELVIHEVKAPSADLGKMDVIGPDGSKVPAKQGSEAYLREVLRRDTELRDLVLGDPGLREGLLNGTTSVRYRLVRPDASGRVTVTEFVIDQSKLDIADWLRD